MLLEQDVFHLGKGKDYFYTIENSDGKKWSLCSNNLKASFEIYEPSGIKGRLLKKYCNLLHIGLVRNILRVRKQMIGLDKDIQVLLEKYFGDNISFSVFFGTPSTDQKITIQLYRDDVVLGYCKIGSSSRVHELFRHESELLNYLNRLSVKHIPKVYYCGEIGDIAVFIQSTEKSIKSNEDHSWSRLHDEFLQQIYSCSSKMEKYENTDYYALICGNYELLPDDDYHLVRDMIEKINRFYKNRIVNWGAIHGDFTPWNTCKLKRGMFVFDFEYGLYCAPKDIDKWHFLIQTNIYEFSGTTSTIASFIMNQFSNDYQNEMLGLETYILFYVFNYLKRGNKDDINQIHNRLDIYRALIKIGEQKNG